MKTQFILPILFLISCSLGSFTSCKEPESTGPENRTDSLMLKVKETDLTTATLYLHTAGITYPASLTLTRNSQPVQTFSLHKPDTTLIDTALTPSTSYTWQAVWKKAETTFLKSEPVTGRTMDSTSHDFMWKLDTLGAPGSILWDVAIVNDTCVWVVGDIVTDPANHPIGRYNAAMWNGKRWKKFRIKLKMWNQVADVFYEDPIKAIFYADQSKLILSSISGGYGVISIKGQLLETKLKDTGSARGSINKIWGTSSQNLFFVGTDGSITHYNGSTFTLMESGTTVDLLDVWGNSAGEVWACGTYYFGDDNLNNPSVLLKKEGQNWKKIAAELNFESHPLNEFPTAHFSSVFILPGTQSLYLSSGFGVFKENIKTGRWQWVKKRVTWFGFPPPEMGVPMHIRGTGENSIFVAGYHNSITHFNGSSWKQMMEPLRQNAWPHGLSVSKHMVIAVGQLSPADGYSGFICLGTPVKKRR